MASSTDLRESLLDSHTALDDHRNSSSDHGKDKHSSHHSSHSHDGGHHGGCDAAAVKTVLLGIAVTLAAVAILIAVVVSVTSTPHSEGATACPDLKRAIYDLLNSERVVHSRFGFYFSTTRENSGHAESQHEAGHSSTAIERDKAGEHSNTIVERNTEHLFPALGNAAYLVAAAASNATDLSHHVNTTWFATTLPSNQKEVCIVGHGDSMLSIADLRDALKQLQDHGVTTVDSLVVDDSFWEPSSYDVESVLPISPVVFNMGQVTITATVGSEDDDERIVFSISQDDVESSCVKIVNHARPGEPTAVESLSFTPVPGSMTIVATGVLPRGHVSTSSVYVLAPAHLMGCTFQHILENAGITTRNVSVGKCTPGGSAVATIKVHTLGDIAKASLQPHGEVHAEVLLRLMGEQTGHGGKDFTEQGFHALQEFMENAVHVEAEYWHLTSASGVLTYRDFVTPEALVAVSRYVSPLVASAPSSSSSGGHKRSEVVSTPTDASHISFESFLSKSGETGLLKTRFVSTVLQGKLWAYVVQSEVVNSISGWMETKEGVVYFSAIHEHWLYGSESIHNVLDQLIFDVATVCDD
eukprot:TRINITY_DN11806_c0_g1_i1.p1 TRINITY_DN11806_c0_g1~~TRINITY_DN11806_c0_g1_i1.p1  ORF type:complete len:584 (+),score=87.13 TRINITY_DN11806_c0_g1_i1:94-1845(+)